MQNPDCINPTLYYRVAFSMYVPVFCIGSSKIREDTQLHKQIF